MEFTSAYGSTVVVYMDFIIFGTKINLIKALKLTKGWLQEKFNLAIKQPWLIIKNNNLIDMMGFKININNKGAVTTAIRKRIFKKLRRQFIRANNELKKTYSKKKNKTTRLYLIIMCILVKKFKGAQKDNILRKISSQILMTGGRYWNRRKTIAKVIILQEPYMRG